MYFLLYIYIFFCVQYVVLEGTKKRKYFNHLGKLIKCDQCGFNPFEGSPIQSYLAQMILCMVHSLVPFELLNWTTYRDYYEEYICADNSDSQITIDCPELHSVEYTASNIYQNLHRRKYYYTSHMKIWNQMYYFLFSSVLGSHKTTRYQHMLSFTSELYCHIAYVLHSTPRTLYGTDPGEHYNDKVKTMVHQMSNKFMSYEKSELPPTAIDTIIKHCIWEYYNVREKSARSNTAFIQKDLHAKQLKQDKQTLKRPADICAYWKSVNVNYKLKHSQFDNITKRYLKKYKSKSQSDILTNIIQNPNLIFDNDYLDSSEEELENEQTQTKHRLSRILQVNLDVVQDLINRQRQTDHLWNDEHYSGTIAKYIYIYLLFTNNM